jgi:hypothetical protein
MTGSIIGAGLLALVGAAIWMRAQALAMEPEPPASTTNPASAPALIYRASALTADQRKVADLIVAMSTDAGLDAPFMLALAVTESSLNPKAIGDDGLSVGLFQLNIKFISASEQELFDAPFNTDAALEKMRLLLRSFPGHSYGDYAEAWTLGGAGRFKKNRRNPAKWTAMQRAIDDLQLTLYLTDRPS